MSTIILSAFIGAIVGGVITAFLSPIFQRLSNNLLNNIIDKHNENIAYLRTSLEKANSKPSFFRRFKLLEESEKQLEKYFNTDEKKSLNLIKKEVDDIKKEREACSPEIQTAYTADNKVSRKYYSFLSSVVSRLEKRWVTYLLKIF